MSSPTRSWLGYAGPRPSAVVPPRRIVAGIPRPLEAICLKALSPEPDGRYQGVAALAADLTRFLEGEPVSAYPEGVWRRTRRFASRYRTPILLVLAYLVMRAVLLLVTRL